MSDTVHSIHPSTNHRTRHRSQTRDHRTRVKLIDIVLIPCYIPIACVVCLGIGGQCLWSLISGKPIPGYCGTGSASARRDHDERRLRKKDLQVLEKEKPRELPRVRKRALSIPLPTTETPFWRKGQETCDQLQSTFFGQLPLEIRELIYKFYLTPDGDPMHVFRRTDRRLGHYLCTFGPESHSHYPKVEWGYGNPSQTRAWKRTTDEKPQFSNNLLPLLKTCRRTYSEAIPFLYHSNTFCFQDIDTLRYFVRTILTCRLHQITEIQLPWIQTYLGFPQPNGKLDHVWEALRQMSNLRTVHIVPLADRRGSGWRYPAWTYWTTRLGSKLDVEVVGYPDVRPLRFALQMSLDGEE